MSWFPWLHKGGRAFFGIGLLGWYREHMQVILQVITNVSLRRLVLTQRIAMS